VLAALTVKAMVVVADNAPDVPVMVIVNVPAGVELVGVTVSTLAPVTGFGLKEKKVLLGRLATVRDTLPANPPWFVTVIVDTPLAPWVTVSEAGAAPRVKLPDTTGCTVTVAVRVIAVPLDGVTVRLKVVVAVGLTLTAVPLVTAILPGVITPVPPVKVASRLELLPDVIVDGVALKTLITGAELTVTVTVWVTAVPVVGVTVSV